MARLRFIVEGQTENRFVETVLTPYLAEFGVYVERPQIVCTSRDRRTGKKQVGGMSSWVKVRNELMRLMRSDHSADCHFTTMFDFYALPNDFPGFVPCSDGVSHLSVVRGIEAAMSEEMADSRLIPYVQLHEFESLVFVAPQKLDMEYFDHQKAIDDLVRQADEFGDPEQVDGGRDTSPSHRLRKAIPEFDKVIAGVNVVEDIGIPRLKERCAHFAEWVGKLEACAVGEKVGR